MTEQYKVGDRVLVVAKVTAVPSDTRPFYRVQYPDYPPSLEIRRTNVIGPAPETDWSKVPFGARVSINGG